MTLTDPASSAAREIKRHRAKTITSVTAEAIEEMIVSGEIAAGDRINESALAERLDISRGPIREACRGLEQAGLLMSRANRGMYVREVSLDEAKDLYELRGAIAGLAGELIVRRGTPGEIAELRRLVEVMQSAADAEDAAAYFRLNLKFHGLLVSAARNGVAEAAYKRIINQLHLLRRRGLVAEGSLQVSNREHREIVAALSERDAGKAAEAMRTHVANGLARLISSL